MRQGRCRTEIDQGQSNRIDSFTKEDRIDFTTCTDLCNKNTDCKFFWHYGYRYCKLFNSCSKIDWYEVGVIYRKTQKQI